MLSFFIVFEKEPKGITKKRLTFSYNKKGVVHFSCVHYIC